MADLNDVNPDDIPVPSDDTDADVQPVANPEAGAQEDEDNKLPEDDNG